VRLSASRTDGSGGEQEVKGQISSLYGHMHVHMSRWLGVSIHRCGSDIARRRHSQQRAEVRVGGLALKAHAKRNDMLRGNARAITHAAHTPEDRLLQHILF
jgi:hypothetical protein